MGVAKQVTAPISGHGEGPCWFPSEVTLRWVDMLVGDVLEVDLPAGAVSRMQWPTSWRPSGHGEAAAWSWRWATGSGAMHRLDPDGSVVVVFTGLDISNGLAWTADHQSAG